MVTDERSRAAIFSPHLCGGTVEAAEKCQHRVKVFNSSVEKYVEKASAAIETAHQHES